MTIDATPLNLAALPVVVAGPMLRRLNRTDVTVWLACTEPVLLTLTVSHLTDATIPPTNAAAAPSRVGRHLFLAVLTAPAPGGSFIPGEAYTYDVSGLPAGRGIDWSVLAIPGSGGRPTFIAPPTHVSDLVILHTSCRKAHAGGRDGLAVADQILATRFTSPIAPQPHLLLLTGDQIYADEVGHPLVPRITRIAADLVGVDETDIFGAPVRIGGRQAPTNSFGLTSGSAANQLWSFGEFLATYLLCWSPVLWPEELSAFPIGQDGSVDPSVDPDVPGELWDRELAALQIFRSTLPAVARVLANVPTLMMCDDHEVTDDWNLDYSWAARVYANKQGRRIVTNGMLAFALCQHWGNVPERYALAGSPEFTLLEGVITATTAGASPAAISAPLLGVPATPLPKPPVSLRDLTDPMSIRFDLIIDPADGWPLRIVLLDERTAREFTRTDGQAARISLAALDLQLPIPTTSVPVTIVVAPSPVLGSDVVEHKLQPLFSLFPGGAESADYESWSAITANHQKLLQRLTTHHPVVILSGDVHYGFTARMVRIQDGATTFAAQFTASAAKNVETNNAMIGVFGELMLRLGIERARDVSGFATLGTADRELLQVPPSAGSVLAWDDTADVLLGRVVRDALESPTAIATPVAEAYGLPAPDWSCRVSPVDDDEHTFNAPAVPEVWEGWQPDHSLVMADALQRADLHRIGRMFVGLPQVGVVSFSSDGSTLTANQELRCPVGDESDPTLHVLATRVVLA